MKAHELLDILACGEDSRHQFKENISNADALAAELSAFANSVGGALYIGVADDGSVKGLTLSDIGRLNQLLSNVASNNIKPPIHPISTNIKTEHGLVMVVEVAEGLNKPYIDAQGKIWVKSGADKRHVTAREEMQRMFQIVNKAIHLQVDSKAITTRPESRPESEQISAERPESRPESAQISTERPESRPESEQISTERPESRPESEQISTERPESRPESDSLSERVLNALQAEPLSKTEIALALGHRSVSGQLNKTIRALLIRQAIEMTLPDTPKSRLQKYRLVISKQK